MMIYFTLPAQKIAVLRMQKFILLSCLCLCSSFTFAKITAEAVLGEYWKDPLFGEAAESHTVNIEVLNGKIWPNTISVKHSETVRFVFLNRSKESHLFAFAKDVDVLINDETFQRFIQDEMYHSKQESKSDPRAHSHSSSSVDDAEAIVKLLAQRPTVFVKPNDIKEILIRFSEPATVELRCVIGAHKDKPMKGIIEVLNNE